MTSQNKMAVIWVGLEKKNLIAYNLLEKEDMAVYDIKMVE